LLNVDIIIVIIITIIAIISLRTERIEELEAEIEKTEDGIAHEEAHRNVLKGYVSERGKMFV
jgi:cell division protein FtsL